MSSINTPCNDESVTESFSFVEGRMQQWTDVALQSVQSALGFVSDLKDFSVGTIAFDNSFTVPDDLLTGMAIPRVPVLPSTDIALAEVPDAPGIGEINTDFGTAPEKNLDRPRLDFPNAPNLPNFTPPNFDDSRLEEINVPDEPTLPTYNLPELVGLDIPDAPALDELTFTGVPPEFLGEVPDVAFNFEEEAYQSDLLDKVKAKVKEIIAGGTGINPAVEQALFDRARSREESNALRAEQEIVEEWAARGWNVPSGVVDARLRELRQGNQNQANALSREIAIQQFEKELEMLRFAVAQGVALENTLINAHLNIQDRALRAAQAAIDSALSILDARVKIFNAEIQLYVADAQVFRERIQAQAEKVNIFRAQIEAERAKGEINEQRVRTYIAQVESTRNLVEIYKSRVEALIAKSQINESKVRTYLGEIEAFRAKIDGKRAEFEGYSTLVQAQLGKVNIYEAESRAFASEVEAYRAGVQGAAEKTRAQISVEDIKLRGYLAQLDKVKTDLQAQVSEVDARTRLFSGQANVFSAQGQIAANQSDANNRQFLAKLEEARLHVGAATDAARIRVGQLQGKAQLLLGATQAGGQASAQLAAAALSAVNVSASLRGTVSQNTDCSTQYSVDYSNLQ